MVSEIQSPKPTDTYPMLLKINFVVDGEVHGTFEQIAYSYEHAKLCISHVHRERDRLQKLSETL